MKMTYQASRIYIWLTRFHRCRGFGVQSPSDYSFIRYVINEHYPYYAYTDLRRAMPDADPLAHRLGSLYFRIANHLQPTLIADIYPTTDAYAAYMHAGCRRAVITHDTADISRADMLRITLSDDTTHTEGYAAIIRNAIATARPGSIVILEGINRNRATRTLWRSIRQDKHAVITFDLHYAGLILFPPNRYLQHYTVCF